jgi:glutathione synthase
VKKKHLFLIDPLERLNIKKDSSLFWAITLQKLGEEVYFLFHEHLYFNNSANMNFLVSEFNGKLTPSLYVDHVTVIGSRNCLIDESVILYMRLDPPFNEEYLHALWILDALESRGATVTNKPSGILRHQEKLAAYIQKPTIDSYVGRLGAEAKSFMKEQEKLGIKEFIIKPLNAYSGIGVFKFKVDDSLEDYLSKKKNVVDIFVIQPFMTAIYNGEIRSIFCRGEEVGSILKKPKEGSYLANIAQGGTFEQLTLSDEVKKNCSRISLELEKSGIDLIAFDILGDKISEVNLTCPGLLVEVSHAYGRNIVSESALRNLTSH